jgi:hypothetical protein
VSQELVEFAVETHDCGDKERCENTQYPDAYKEIEITEEQTARVAMKIEVVDCQIAHDCWEEISGWEGGLLATKACSGCLLKV